MVKQLENKVFKTPITLSFYLFSPDRRNRDRANVLNIVEKFFCDALTHYGCIVDDCDKYIESTHYYSGEIDKSNPRVEVIIQEKEIR